MQKTLDFIERYVQWFALGLAGLILLWVAYAYVLTPVTVKVGSRELTPGEVDAAVKRDAADRLKSAMDDKTPVQFQVGDWRAQVARIFEPTTPASPQVIVQGTETGQPGGSTKPSAPVAEPVLAKAVFAAQSFGRGAVLFPDPNAKPDPNNPRIPVGMAQKDVDWRSITWHVKMEDLIKAFDDAHLPDNARMTQFLGRTLIRQEMQPNGQWGPDAVVPELPGQELQPIPADAPQATPEQWAFIKWAQDNAQLIMQPAFLQQVQQTGTMWYAPGSQPPPEEGVRPTPVVAPRATPAPAPRGAGGSPSTPPPAGGGRAPPPAGGPYSHAAEPGAPVPNNAGHRSGPFQYPQTPGSFRYPNPNGPAGAAPTYPTPNVTTPQQAGAPAGMVNAGPLPGVGTPDGRFNPAEAQDFDLLTHDITAQPGKTYRYKVRYTLLNPAWNRMDLSPTLAKKFSLTSPDSDWTSEIRVPQRVEFWIVRALPQRRSADFDVFEWKGQWTKRTVTVSPGDTIGDSSWMLVDVRDDGHSHAYALVADTNAKTVRRDPRLDATDAKHLQLDGQVAPAGGNAAAGIVP